MVHDISIENQCLNWYFVIVNDPIEIAIEKTYLDGFTVTWANLAIAKLVQNSQQ